MMQRPVMPLIAAAVLLAALAPAHAGAHLPYIAQLVVAYGDEVISPPEAEQQLTNYDPESGLVRDGGGRLNIAESSLNYAVALLEMGREPERAARVIEAVLQSQDRAEGSPTRGLFRWMHGGATADVNATLYLAPALAHLTRELGESGRAGEALRSSAALALAGLLANPKTADAGFGALMWAGAVCTLGDAVGAPQGPQAGAQLVSEWLGQVSRRGMSDGNSPTYDALRIGGLRWAWQAASDEAARAQAELALELCYRDLLQRYDPSCGAVGGAMATAYQADYTGDIGVPGYLLASDLASALSRLHRAQPLAMYFALADYDLSDELAEVAEERGEPYVLRTRIPGEDATQPELAGTCTWVSPAGTLGTMSGPVGRWSMPVMVTAGLDRRPTSYWYLPDVAGHVQSAQAGSLALCSFTFDNIGLPGRTQARVRAVLGYLPDLDRVLVNGVEWIGEPAAVGEAAVVSMQRGDAYLAIKVLGCGYEGSEAGGKPGILTYIGEGENRAVVLDLYGRQADYVLRKPLHDVRVSMLIEMSAAADWESLDEFARTVRPRRVTEEVRTESRRARELEETNPLERNQPVSRAEMVFIKSTLHTMKLVSEELALGLVENMTDRTLVSRTLPEPLPESYLWLSPALTLNAGGDLGAALGQ